MCSFKMFQKLECILPLWVYYVCIFWLFCIFCVPDISANTFTNTCTNTFTRSFIKNTRGGQVAAPRPAMAMACAACLLHDLGCVRKGVHYSVRKGVCEGTCKGVRRPVVYIKIQKSQNYKTYQIYKKYKIWIMWFRYITK